MLTGKERRYCVSCKVALFGIDAQEGQYPEFGWTYRTPIPIEKDVCIRQCAGVS